ncbi:MAG: efflux RND transporter permease subunit [Gammaproteobacteria bacterium]
MWLTRISINNPVFAAMMMAALMVLGTFSYNALPVEEFPNVEMPFVIVTTPYPGASPESVESDISRPIEDAVNTVNGVKKVFSTSYEGFSLVVVEFHLEIDPDTAVQDVRDKISAVKAEFRDEIDEPIIQRWDPGAQPVLSASFTSDTLSTRDLTTLVDQRLLKRLQVISGVGKVDLIGGVKREVRVFLRPADMQARAIGVNQVVHAIRTDNQDLPAGSIEYDNREQTVQIKARMTSAADFGRVVVGIRSGTPVYLEDVADIVDGEEELESIALVDGKRAVAIDVVKISGANTISVAEKVRAALDAMQAELPEGVTLTIVADASRSIRAGLEHVQRTLLEGAALAVFIVLLFLGSWRSTMITGLTLPISLLGTVFSLWLFGFTINMMTLMAMSLCIGLLIDDAIVVRENIVRHGAMGKDPRTAALEGTSEIGLAVLATTLSIVAVFLPVAFMGGIIGKFFFQFGVTVSCAVLLSMFVSFTLDPMLSSIWRDPHVHGVRGTSWFSRMLDGFAGLLDRVGDIYMDVIRWALAHRKSTLAIAGGSLVIAFALIAFIGKEFVPEPDLSEISVKFSTPIGSSLAFTEAKTRQVDAIIRRHNEVIATYATINGGGGFETGKNETSFRVALKPKGERELGQKALVAVLRQELAEVGGIEVKSVAAAKEAVSGGMKPIMISIQGTDLGELQRISDEFTADLRKIPGLVDIESSLKEPRPLLAVDINREMAADQGLSVGTIAAALRPLLAGDAISSWQAPDGENYDVTVQLPLAGRSSLANLDDIWLASGIVDPQTGAPRMVALSQVATVSADFGAAQIKRRNQFREVLIQANVEGRPSGDVGGDINQVMARMTPNLPLGYRFEVEGQNKDMEESIHYANIALALAIIFIYMVLGSQFNSFLHPVAIMTSLPLSLIGVFLALFIFRSTLNIFSIIGIVMLMGLVTKNAILLIDFIKVATDNGMERTEAIMKAGHTRLRPILMTTAAMVFGMIPLALGLGEGSEQSSPMAHAIIGGLITSTLLTLIVVPVIYTYLDDFTQWLKKVLRIGVVPAG